MRVMLYEAAQSMLSSSEHAAFEEMVMAQGLGDADRRSLRNPIRCCDWAAQFSIAEIGVLFPRLFLRLFPRY
jgi:hypothetical protein